MASGGKREGAGRKPNTSEGKSGYFSSRISDRLKQMLEEAAEANGVSLSSEIQRRLELSFTDKRKSEQARRAIERAVKLVGPDAAALLAAEKNLVPD